MVTGFLLAIHTRSKAMNELESDRTVTEFFPSVCYDMSHKDLREAIALVRDLIGRSGSMTEERRKLYVHFWRLLEMQHHRAGLYEERADSQPIEPI